ncbi:hypothetical protein [Pimelobacter sp. 30-1]|uniref:hypothetical protein n=1 Tax=Pimelobacter sp. 30-1 TaxID=2004991 RepID=UPI001C03EDB0|nr:hypothetical protein [Pimelobacter sp. 30-1]MBU2698594.1 hypothetical protein [Pimelobacter sp. 30-1]
MTGPRPDVRLESAPMQPVGCGTCGAEVLARKSSWDQTTVQWNTAALARCPERRTTQGAAVSDRPNRNAFPGCAALRASLRAAAVAGTLDVQSDEPLKTNPEAAHD